MRLCVRDIAHPGRPTKADERRVDARWRAGLLGRPAVQDSRTDSGHADAYNHAHNHKGQRGAMTGRPHVCVVCTWVSSVVPSGGFYSSSSSFSYSYSYRSPPIVPRCLMKIARSMVRWACVSSRRPPRPKRRRIFSFQRPAFCNAERSLADDLSECAAFRRTPSGWPQPCRCVARSPAAWRC